MKLKDPLARVWLLVGLAFFAAGLWNYSKSSEHVMAKRGKVTEKSFEEEVIQAFAREGSRSFSNLSLEEFLRTKLYVRTTGKYIKYSFDGNAPLLWIARNMAHANELDVQKAAQVWVSTFFVGRGLYLTDGEPINCSVYFPDAGFIKDFVQYKFDTIIENSPYFSEVMEESTGADNTRVKQIGKSIWVFRGTGTMMAVKSFDSDVSIEDEVDEHDAERLEFASDRLGASTMGYRMSGSQPSVDDFGINARFKAGTQHWWHVKCGACNSHFDIVNEFLADPDRVVRGGKYCCPKCARPVNNQSGEYVAKFPSREKKSVQVSKLGIRHPRYNAPYILKKFKEADTVAKKKRVHISDIGVPFSTDDEKPVTVELLKKQRGDQGFRSGADWMTYFGADQGDIVHGIFGEQTRDNRCRLIALAEWNVLDEDQHISALQRFSVYSGVVDALPNKSWSKRMALRFPDIIQIQYSSAKRFIAGDEAALDGEVPYLNYPRDEALQDTVDALKNGFFIFPDPARLGGPDLELFQKMEFHLLNLVKERKEDEHGRPTYSFKKKVQNHFGIALTNLRLAMLAPLQRGGTGVQPLFG